MRALEDGALAVGQVLWTPPPDARERFELGRYLEWLRDERGLDFPGYEELHRWSISDLEGFWGSLWDYFEIRAHTPYERVLGSRELPGAEWFPGARLNFAEHMLGRDEDTDSVAVVARSQSRGPLELTFGDLREQVARARAGLQRLGVVPGDRVVAYLPNIPETLVAFLATASLGAIWATCPPEFGTRSVISRLGQLEPTVLLGGCRLPLRRQARRSPRASGRRPGAVAIAARRSCTFPTRAAKATPSRTQSAGTSSWPSKHRSSSSPLPSHTRCTCSSRLARRGCRRRSCTATAASSSST